jgi:hypothetical protein
VFDVQVHRIDPVELHVKQARSYSQASGMKRDASLNSGAYSSQPQFPVFASLIDGLSRGFFQDAEFRKIVEADLTHRNPTNHPEYFTTACFHRPEEFAAEVGGAGFGDIQILAIEGPAWSTTLFREVWNDAGQRQRLLEFLSLIEGEPSIQGASAHVMAVAFRPN